RKRAFRDALRQRLALDQLHHEEVRLALAADVIKHTYIRMVERGDRLRFALEARAHFRIRREVLREHLDSDFATQARVLRAIHFAHAARTEGRNDFVRTEFGSRVQRHFHSTVNSVDRCDQVQYAYDFSSSEMKCGRISLMPARSAGAISR